MKSIGLKCAGPLAALAATVACSTTAVPPTAAFHTQYTGQMLSVNGRLVTAERLSPMPRYATILPELRAQANKFEYVINFYGTYAGIFDYPTSVQEIRKIHNVGGQGCTNVLYGYGKKYFWIVAADNQITLYKVPKKRIRSLSDSIGMPSSCAWDPGGDLAVGILSGSRTAGDVIIYKNASGSGTVYKTPLTAEYFDGYDDSGNLFADGFNDTGHFQLAELPKGSSKFKAITTSNTVQFPGSIQWDGDYITVFDQKTSSFYRYTISGSEATLQSTISLQGSGDCAQTWIVKGLVYCGDAGNNDGEVFEYPGGGSAIATFTGSFAFPLGVVAAER